jgi:5'-nucleotidase
VERGGAVAMQPIILVDMDGVIADFEGGFLDEWKRRHPTEPAVSLEQRSKFYIVDQYPKLRGSVRDIFKSRNFFLNLKPIPGSISAIRELASMGLEVFICSSPIDDYRYCVAEKYAWVDQNLGTEWVRKLILTKDKTLIDANVLIDDRPEVVGVVTPPKWEHIIYDQPYNRRVVNKQRLTWNNWREVLSSVESLRVIFPPFGGEEVKQ